MGEIVLVVTVLLDEEVGDLGEIGTAVGGKFSEDADLAAPV